MFEAILSALVSNTTTGTNLSELELKDRYQTVHKKISSIEDKMSVFKTSAESSARKKMLLGLLALCGNFGFIFMGTYHWYTWDIVEPIAFFLDLGTAILLMSLFFMGGRGEYSNEWFHSYLTKKKLNKTKEWVSLKKSLNKLKNTENDYL